MKNILEQYQRCLNRIDDFLEYRYQKCSKEEMRARILNELSILTEEIEKEMNKVKNENN